MVDAPTLGPDPVHRLTPREQVVVAELRRVDAAVRRHEQAHLAAGGSYVRSGPHYTYRLGPDGRLYAVAGEVVLDTTPEADPEATVRKMQAVQRAALAPADPSPQDRAAAARAARQEEQARREAQERRLDLYL